MRHLVCGYVQGRHRVLPVRAVAVAHAEAAVLPVGVGEGNPRLLFVVDSGGAAATVVGYAMAAEAVKVEVPRRPCAVRGVHRRGLRVRRRSVTPHIDITGEQDTAGSDTRIERPMATALGVDQGVRAVLLAGGANRDLPAVQAVALSGLHMFSVPQGVLAHGVRHNVTFAGGTVLLHTGDDRLPSQFRLITHHPDDLAGGRARGRLAGALRHSLAQGRRLRRGRRDLGLGRRQGQLHLGGVGDSARPIPLMDNQVTTNHRQSGIGTLVAGVHRAVGVLDHVLRDQLLLRAQTQRTGSARRRLGRLVDKPPTLPGRQADGPGPRPGCRLDVPERPRCTGASGSVRHGDGAGRARQRGEGKCRRRDHHGRGQAPPGPARSLRRSGPIPGVNQPKSPSVRPPADADGRCYQEAEATADVAGRQTCDTPAGHIHNRTSQRTCIERHLTANAASPK